MHFSSAKTFVSLMSQKTVKMVFVAFELGKNSWGQLSWNVYQLAHVYLWTLFSFHVGDFEFSVGARMTESKCTELYGSAFQTLHLPLSTLGVSRDTSFVQLPRLVPPQKRASSSIYIVVFFSVVAPRLSIFSLTVLG